jgi:hypothetical protein
MPDSPRLSDEFDQNEWDAADWAEHLLDGSNPQVKYEAVNDLVQAKSDGGDYSGDWSSVSFALKQKRGWTCEMCRFTLLNSGLIHVHHLNGVKTDNSVANLQVLCALCHGRKHSSTFNLATLAPPVDVDKLMAWGRKSMHCPVNRP